MQDGAEPDIAHADVEEIPNRNPMPGLKMIPALPENAEDGA